VVKHLITEGRVRVDNLDEVVILSASTLSDYFTCSELWRRRGEGGGEEESESLEVGTVLHAGLAELYRQLMEG
jgi:hypothetical protein